MSVTATGHGPVSDPRLPRSEPCPEHCPTCNNRCTGAPPRYRPLLHMCRNLHQWATRGGLASLGMLPIGMVVFLFDKVGIDRPGIFTGWL